VTPILKKKHTHPLGWPMDGPTEPTNNKRQPRRH